MLLIEAVQSGVAAIPYCFMNRRTVIFATQPP
jgi:hypothetical protein